MKIERVDIRGKLVDILGEFLLWPSKMKNVWMYQAIEKLADHLIDNGVTVQEWIPVNDSLPEPKENAICINRHGDMMIGTYTEWGWMFPCYFKIPTHWMPLPNLPKEASE